jgi:hypothetical protein
MANLSPAELRKYDWRPAVFVRKLKEKEPFEVTGGKKVVLVYVKGVETILEKGSSKQLGDLRFTDGKGGVYKLSDFIKNKDFGGKGAGSGTVKEDRALMQLREQIQEAKAKEGRSEIIVRIDGRDYKCADVVSTPGTPKSDFHLVDADGKETVWMSHKDGKTEKDFQQWGGMSERVEPAIYRHRESQKFIKEMNAMFPTGIPNATTVARKIKDRYLKQMAVYGNEFSKPFSRQNTTLMLQGAVVLKKSGGKYIIDAYHSHVNGDNMEGGYEPVFMAIYKGDRSDFGIKGARVVIAPFGCRKITYMV